MHLLSDSCELLNADLTVQRELGRVEEKYYYFSPPIRVPDSHCLEPLETMLSTEVIGSVSDESETSSARNFVPFGSSVIQNVSCTQF